MIISLIFLRSALSSMDQAPRAAFVAAVVKPEERTAVMGIKSMIRTFAQSAGPTLTGLLAGGDHFWIAFVIAGCLKASYDLGLWALFINMKLNKHESSETEVPDRRDSGLDDDIEMTRRT
jgi:predicted MFS family arabinose efflux permease